MTLQEATSTTLSCSAEPISDGQARRDVTAKRIIFVNRYFYPDHSATSQILTDLAFHLAEEGHAVRVLTSTQRYDDPRAQLSADERAAGVAISRLATTRFGRSALLGRGVDYLSFYHAAWRSILDQASPGDVLVVKTDPPLLSVVAMQAAKRRGLRLVNWLQDLYPEAAVELGVPFLGRPVAGVLTSLRDATLRSAEANVVIGERMAETLRSHGVPSGRIHVIPNWCDDEQIRPVAHDSNPLRREWGLEDKFVVGYSGNLGKAHEFDTVLEAAEILRDDPRIIFLFIGGGSKFDVLARLVSERKLDHCFRFLPYQDRSALRYSLGLPDIHLVSLKPELEGLIVPSKFYGIAAAGRPIIAVTARDGELARLVQINRCGTVIEPGKGQELAAVLRSLSTDAHRCDEMGLRARAMLDAQFTRKQAFEKWRGVLEGIT